MHRQIAIITLGLAAVAGLNAGQIQIGSGLNGTNGLTSVYTVAGQGGITASTTATQASGGTFGETTYAKTLYQNSTLSSTAPTPGSQVTAGGVTFNLINDAISGPPNFWAGTNDGAGVSGNPNPSTTTITIPMGIFGVTNVYTMLNDEYGVSGANNVDVTFNFGAGGLGGSLTFDLVNGQVYADSFDCLAGSGLSACALNNYAMTVDSVHSFNAAGVQVVPSAGTATVSSLGVAWSGTYSASTLAPYANTSGNLFLDAQNFYLGSFAGSYLYNVVITDTNTGLYTSRTELSAITVASSTPEPSTWLLFGTGIAAVFFVAKRRKSAASIS